MLRGWIGAAAGMLLATAAAAQDHRVTVTFEGVHSSQGKVLAALCGDPKGGFPNGCTTYTAMAKAAQGQTVLTFDKVPSGAYALQAFHDENGDFRPEIPPEGYAFGNDASWPPTFDSAAIKVDGDVQVHVHMTYLGGAAPGAAPGAAADQGVQPPAGVQRIDVRDGGLYGELYLPAGARRPPAILLLGGSEGGVDTISSMAVSFARQGYAALALAYWAEPGLPRTLELVPLEYFDRAVAWLKARPDVDGRAIGAIGWSRGAEAVLLLASRNRDIRAVAAVAPTGTVWKGLNFGDIASSKPAWTVGGRPLPYVEPGSASYRPGGPMAVLFADRLAEADRRPETAIPVERINGPVLLIAGEDDALWPSAVMARKVAARLRAAGFRHEVETLSYPGAGHAVFVGEPDGLMARALGRPNPMFGGTAEGDARARADDWPKALSFFDKALKNSR